MKEKHYLKNKLSSAQQLVVGKKIKRILNKPIKYINYFFIKKILYDVFKYDVNIKTNTFFERQMHLCLPSGTDIYLTGCKSHNSEIRLAKYFIQNIKPGNIFVDMGAHFGYYTLLAAELVGQSGKVLSFEASPKSYSVLKKNTEFIKWAEARNLALSDSNNPITFYEFPNLYAENNTTSIEQFEKQDWFIKNPPKEIKIPSTTVDQALIDFQSDSVFVKIDVEGAEFKVINGGEMWFQNFSPTIVMEYIADGKINKEHQKAFMLLTNWNYKPYFIGENGELERIKNIDEYFDNYKLESDNIVFKK